MDEEWKVIWHYTSGNVLLLPEKPKPSKVMAQEYAKGVLELLEKKGSDKSVFAWEAVRVD